MVKIKSLQIEKKLAPETIHILVKQGYQIDSYERFFNLRFSKTKIQQILGHPLYDGYVDLRKICELKQAVFDIEEPIFFSLVFSPRKDRISLDTFDCYTFLQKHDYLPLTYYKHYSMLSILLQPSELNARFRREIIHDFYEAIDLLTYRIEEKFEEELHKIASIIFDKAQR